MVGGVKRLLDGDKSLRGVMVGGVKRLSGGDKSLRGIKGRYNAT